MKASAKPRRLAVVDVGSNSVRRMVADVSGRDVAVVSRDTITTRLLSGLENGRFTVEAMRRSAEALARHVTVARAEGAERIMAFGTSAMRDAENSQELSAMCATLCGVDIEVVSGEEEARLAYLGASRDGDCAVLDVGGGSTELLLGENGRVKSAASAHVGAVRLRRQLPGDECPALMTDAAEAAMRAHIAPFARAKGVRWVGVGGTITTLAAMCLRVNKYESDRIEGHPISRRDAEAWLRQLCAMRLDERYGLAGLSKTRADVIPFGVAAVVAAMRLIGIETLFASDHDNLEGFIRSRML